MDPKEEIEVIEFVDPIEEQPNISVPINHVPSQFTESYLKLMQISSIEETDALRQASFSQLATARILSDEEQSISELTFRIVSYTPNYECLILKVCYHRFTFILSLIFVKEESAAHQIHISFSGNFSTKYRTKIFNKPTAIKCTRFTTNFAKVFKNTLTEYLIYRVAAQLKIGPKMEKMLGFDLVVYQNCIEFCMEFCQQNLNDRKYIIQRDLVHGLKTLHSIKIIHLDIKPQNICYSEGQQRVVFIDYGLHKVIEENIGFKTLTNFQGTVDFSSKQMQGCYYASDSRFIDLYFNDAHCLWASLENIQNFKCDFMKRNEGGSLFDLTAAVIVLIFTYIFYSKQTSSI